MDIKKLLLASERQGALALIAGAINDLTIAGRDAYDRPDAAERLSAVNEAIHRLSGHLRDLCDLDEVLTPSRADGVVEAMALIDHRSRDRLLGWWLQRWPL